jgi:hypothetical protein
MSFMISRIADYGMANPILARLTVQAFDILDHCDIRPEDADAVKLIYMDSLTKKLVRCYEIAQRYQAEFVKELEAYRQLPKHPMMVEVPHILRLEEECHNFLYEAKSFVRDLLKAFNILYGTTFAEASNYFRPETAKNGKQSLIWYAETTFGPNDPKTERFKDMVEAVERVVDYRNAVEHPGGHSGTLKIRNFRLDANGKFSEPGWWIEKDGKAGVESSIGADVFGIVENLLMLAEEMVVIWANDNLRFPQFSRVAWVPEERRDRNNPIQYVVTASAELEQKFAELEAHQKSQKGAG